MTGKVTFKTASGEETFETGDAYYVPPGHTPKLYAGTEVIEFSPTLCSSKVRGYASQQEIKLLTPDDESTQG